MRFAGRASWDLRENALTTLLAEKRAGGEPILDLTESNPTRAGFVYDDDAILRALAAPQSLRYEPTPAGLTCARDAVAAYYAERAIAVDPGRILLTASTSEAYSFVFKLLCDPGARVLVPAPSYPLFEFLATLEGVHVDTYPLAYHDGWSIDLDALSAAIHETTRAIVVVSPNNPTGSFLRRTELAALRSLCRAHDLALVCDEVFADYALSQTVEDDPERVRSVAAEESVLTFALSGLSKVAVLPQVKLGWMVVTGPVADATRAYERLEIIADTFLSVGTPVQHAASELFRLGAGVREQIRKRTRANLAALDAAVTGSSCTRLRVDGGWSATLRIPRLASEEATVLALLREEGTLVHPGHFFDFPGEAYVVVSLLTDARVFAEGVARLLRLTRG